MAEKKSALQKEARADAGGYSFFREKSDHSLGRITEGNLAGPEGRFWGCGRKFAVKAENSG